MTSLSILQQQTSIIPTRHLNGGILHVVLQNGEAARQVRRAERVHHVKPLFRQEQIIDTRRRWIETHIFDEMLFVEALNASGAIHYSFKHAAIPCRFTKIEYIEKYI